MAATKTLEQRKLDFLNRLKVLYPEYKLISGYENADTFILLEYIPTGEVWKVKPRYLNGKRQAPGVAKANKPKTKIHKWTQEIFEQKFYEKWSSDEYQVIGKYQKQHEEIEILHKKCGKVFTPTPSNMLYNNKKGCTDCYGKTKVSIESYQIKFNQIKELKDYTILSIESKNGHIFGNVKHNCELCENHIFNIRLSDMLSKHAQRCPRCKDLNQESKAVRDIKEYLTEKGYKFIQEAKFKSCKNTNKLPFDFYLPEYRTIIEYDGQQHFKPSFHSDKKIAQLNLERTQRNDIIKNEWCKKKKINLLRIKYTQDHMKVLTEFLNNL